MHNLAIFTNEINLIEAEIINKKARVLVAEISTYRLIWRPVVVLIGLSSAAMKVTMFLYF
jgi:hypothetical protein